MLLTILKTLPSLISLALTIIKLLKNNLRDNPELSSEIKTVTVELKAAKTIEEKQNAADKISHLLNRTLVG